MEVTGKGRPEREKAPGLQFLKKLALQEKPLLRRAVINGSLATVMTIIHWLFLAFIADAVITQRHDILSLWAPLFFFVLAAVARPWLQFKQNTLSQKASINIRRVLRTRLLRAWENTSPVELQKVSPGAHASQWIEDVDLMDGYFSKYLPQQYLALVSPFLILCVVTYLNWLCGILLLLSAPLIPLFMVLVGMGAEHINQKYALLRQRLAGHFLDRIANLSTILFLGGRNTVSDEVRRRSDGYRKVVMKTLRLAFLSSTVLEFFTSIAIASLAIYIGFSLYGAITWGPASTLTLFSGLAILLLAPEFFKPLRTLSQYYHDRANALGAANNLIDGGLLNVPSPPAKQFVAFTSDTENLTLEMIDLVAGYEQQRNQHLPINEAISSSGLLAISGESGRGKTALLNTIAGYINPVSGTLNIKPSRSIPIAYLPQRPWIKNATVRDNLRVTAHDATDTEMIAVLRQLELEHELLNRHEGLDTWIGEHGQGLSGGQMQRLALSRVLLAPTSLILLDEPTASLDMKSKLLITDSLKSLSQNALVVVATHDQTIVDMADKHILLRSEGHA